MNDPIQVALDAFTLIRGVDEEELGRRIRLLEDALATYKMMQAIYRVAHRAEEFYTSRPQRPEEPIVQDERVSGEVVPQGTQEVQRTKAPNGVLRNQLIDYLTNKPDGVRYSELCTALKGKGHDGGLSESLHRWKDIIFHNPTRGVWKLLGTREEVEAIVRQRDGEKFLAQQARRVQRLNGHDSHDKTGKEQPQCD